MDARLAPTASAIAFDRIKYGRRLLVDACRIGAIPGFIRTPVPHRLRFHEIALVTSGRGALELDGVGVEVGASRLCITAPGEVRRWRLDDPARLDGWLVFFEAGLLDEFFADASFVSTLPVLGGPAAGRSLALDAKRFDALAAIADAMHRELSALQPDSVDVLRAETYRLLLALQRAAGAAQRPPPDRSRAIAERYLRLVDAGHADGAGVERYAERLGISARHLNHCVQAATGRSASDVIRERLFLEARRLLLGTDLTAAQIAERLNFSDASYFGRFFRRHAGTTPRAFRRQQASPVSSPLRPLPPNSR